MERINGTSTHQPEASLAVDPPQETPLLIRAFVKMREDLAVGLLELTETSLRQRAQSVPDLNEVRASEALVRAQAGQIEAIAYFVEELSALNEAGVPMPDISLLTPPKPARLKRRVSQLKVNTSTRPAKLPTPEPERTPEVNLLSGKAPNLDDPEVRRLTERAQAGDMDAFEQICRMYYGSMYRFILKRVDGDEQLAFDFTQDLFTRAQKKIGASRPGTLMSPWLFRIARNLIIDYHRGPGKKSANTLPLDPEHHDHEDQQSNLGEDSISNLELSLDLTAALDQLTPEQRQVLEYRFLQGLNTADTARATGRSEDAVKKLQSRGLANLRRILKIGK